MHIGSFCNVKLIDALYKPKITLGSKSLEHVCIYEDSIPFKSEASNAFGLVPLVLDNT